MNTVKEKKRKLLTVENKESRMMKIKSCMCQSGNSNNNKKFNNKSNNDNHIYITKYIQKSMYAYIKSNIEHKIHKSD